MGGGDAEAGWATLGHTVSALILFQAVVYMVLTVGHFGDHWTLAAFGKNWAKDGFCLSFKDTLYHTHLLCLYGDFVLAAVLYSLVRGSKRSELAGVLKGIPSILMHGLAHGYLWRESTQRSYGPTDYVLQADTLVSQVLVTWVVLLGFWISFLSQELPLSVALAESVLLSYLLAYHIPMLLAFTFVNVAINFNITGVQLVKGVEGSFDKFYALMAILVSVPINAAAWAEPLFCDSFLVRWGGHILFDYTIPASLILYVIVASALPPRRASKLE